jgi:hypothetical protein
MLPNTCRGQIASKLGTRLFSLLQLHQRALACESRNKEASKLAGHNVHLVKRDSSDDEHADVYTTELV